MLRQYSISTRLVSIIQTIQLSRETGVLIAKRGEENSAEEGRIVFTNGRITEIKVSKRHAADAFNYISTWENCVASFTPQDPSRSSEYLFEKFSLVGSVLPEEQKKTGTPSGPLPKGVRPVHEHHQTRAHTSVSNTAPALNSSLSLSLATYIPILTHPLPVALQNIEQVGLSRAHRQLILLIDGKRSIGELSHILGRSVDTIHELLQDFMHLGLV